MAIADLQASRNYKIGDVSMTISGSEIRNSGNYRGRKMGQPSSSKSWPDTVIILEYCPRITVPDNLLVLKLILPLSNK